MRKTNERNAVYCKQGHAYDPREHEMCPYCYGEDANRKLDLTQSVNEEEDMMPTERVMNEEWSWEEDMPTESAFVKECGIDPVVGWLVTLTGENRGQDYRIHAENNYIGRSPHMDICIKEDDAVTKDKHASIAFDTRSKKFYFTPCNARNIVHINDNAIFSTTELKAYDIIELGVTRFIFVPFCGEDFDWSESLSNEEKGE